MQLHLFLQPPQPPQVILLCRTLARGKHYIPNMLDVVQVAARLRCYLRCYLWLVQAKIFWSSYRRFGRGREVLTGRPPSVDLCVDALQNLQAKLF